MKDHTQLHPYICQDCGYEGLGGYGKKRCAECQYKARTQQKRDFAKTKYRKEAGYVTPEPVKVTPVPAAVMEQFPTLYGWSDGGSWASRADDAVNFRRVRLRASWLRGAL